MMLKLEGYDQAAIGVVERCGEDPLICYDYEKLIKIIMETSEPKSSYRDAQDFVDFNIAGSAAGPGTPVILYEMTMEEIDIYAEGMKDGM